jgi:hypothetical protein
LQLGRRPHGPQGIVLVQLRDAEHGHDRVSDELLHRAAVLLERASGFVEVAPHHAADCFRIKRLAESGGAGHVGEDHGDNRACLRHRSSVRLVSLVTYTAASQGATPDDN